MPIHRDRKNERYGRLIVLEKVGKNHKGKYIWKCICDCGNTKEVSSDNLSSGKSKSCGCLKKEFLAKKGNQFGFFPNRQEALLRVDYHHLKKRNKKIGGGEIITFEEFKTLSLSACNYCGVKSSKTKLDRSCETKSKKKVTNFILKTNGIDRVENQKGYESGNCVPCCKTCNSAKGTLSIKEFESWALNFKAYFIDRIENGESIYQQDLFA